MKTKFCFLFMVLFVALWSCVKNEYFPKADSQLKESDLISFRSTAFSITSANVVDPYSVSELSALFNSQEFNDYLESNDFSFTAVRQVVVDDQHSCWVADIVKAGSSSEYVLAFYPMPNNTISSLLYELSHLVDSMALTVNDIADGVVIFSGSVNDGPPVLERINCREETETFRKCMKCALDVLTDDWIGGPHVL